MIFRLVALAALASAAWPQLTTITQTLRNADGTPWVGTLDIALGLPCTTPGGDYIQTNIKDVAVRGLVSVSLYPNTTCTPSGTSYRVTYRPAGAPSLPRPIEYWVVGGTSPTTIDAVRVAIQPQPMPVHHLFSPTHGDVASAAVPNRGDLIRRGAVRWELLSPGDIGDCLRFSGTDPIWQPCPGASGGEANTASNVGTAGVGLFEGKSGVDLQFRKLNPLSNRLSIALDAPNQKVDLDVAQENLTITPAQAGMGPTDAAEHLRITLPEIAEPATPSADKIGIYAEAGNGGITRLRLKDDTGRTIQVARDNIAIVRNVSGATISKGAAVTYCGSTGAASQVCLAQADSATTTAIGVAWEDIPSPGWGRVIYAGYLDGLVTTGLTEGQPAYLSAATPGALTSTPPAAPNLRQIVATVVRTHGSQGVLEIDSRTALNESVLNLNNPTRAVGTTPGTVAAGDDGRLSDARTPTAHAGTHATGQSDALSGTLAVDVSGNAGTVTNGLYSTGSYADPAWITSLAKAKVGLGSVENTALSTWPGSGNITALGTIASGAVPWARLSDVPSTFTPAAHAASHLGNGADAIGAATATVRGTVTTTTSSSQVASTDDSRLSDARTPTAHASSHLSNGSDAIAAASTTVRGTVTTTTATTQVASNDDSRLSDARTPTAHSTSHKSGGSDEVATATPTVNAIPKAGVGGTLATGWIPDLSSTYAAVSHAHTIYSRTGPGISFDGGGDVVEVGKVGYRSVEYACTIVGWSIVAVGTNPTATIDVWKVASGTTLPTVANTITAGAKMTLSTGNAITSSSIPGWTVSVAQDDRLAYKIDAVANATNIEVKVICAR